MTDFTFKNIVTLFFDCIYIRVNEDDVTKILQANPYQRKLDFVNQWVSPQNSPKWSITKRCISSASLMRFITLCLPSCANTLTLHSFKWNNFITLFGCFCHAIPTLKKTKQLQTSWVVFFWVIINNYPPLSPTLR